ncbi:hypothetical protein Dda_5051 [Drechslerella dactyloides]|uniref:Uncharacterized protein n=1 Tax=Drechslerella dactyloides TaxID=74499 RepID=A0AAD6J0D0_DREDA|nr:hypothetical protein Dda_5051 [Drechslerella dactyloides]
MTQNGSLQLVSCSELGVRTSFENYISELRELLGEPQDFSKLYLCQDEICGALWGTVNTDIAGPGVTASYIIGNSLGLLSVVVLIVYWETSRYRGKRSLNTRSEVQICKCIDTLHLCLLWLCAPVQIASIVLLVKADFGIDAAGLEFPTLSITWAVSLLTLLPLVHLAFLPNETGCHAVEGLFDSPSDSFHSHRDQEEGKIAPSNDSLFRLKALAVCWVLSAYSFLSRMLEMFSPGKIGDDAGSVVSTDEWTQIESLCLEGVQDISGVSRKVFTAFGILGWIWVSLFAIVGLIRITQHQQSSGPRNIRSIEKMTTVILRGEYDSAVGMIFMRVALVIVTPVIAGVNIWSIFATQNYQGEIARNAGSSKDTPTRGFGQIMAY